MHKGLGILEKHEVTFDLYVVPGSLCHVATIAQKFPKLKLVIDHIGKPKVQVKLNNITSFKGIVIDT